MKLIIPIIIILAAIGGVYWWYTRPAETNPKANALVGSGRLQGGFQLDFLGQQARLV